MIEKGQQKEAGNWGKFSVEEVIKLAKPVTCNSISRGKARFNPTLVKIKWEIPRSGYEYEFWFPYWIGFEEAKERYGQYAPMINEDSLLELFQKAIRDGLFSDNFLQQINVETTKKLSSKKRREH